MSDDEKQISLTMVKRMFKAMFAEVNGNLALNEIEANSIGENSELRAELDADGTTSLHNVEGTICCGWWKDCTVRH